ncbi:transposon Ty3-I Gag-Pol polyprotein [Trichonephila clavipes]|nr:transposon Ty3-I Gag-Pol polyprotein [Trichonephila clavipes]
MTETSDISKAQTSENQLNQPIQLIALDSNNSVESLVYADKPQTLDDLEDNIRRVIADIRPQMLEKVIENWTSRLDYIRASHGKKEIKGQVEKSLQAGLIKESNSPYSTQVTLAFKHDEGKKTRLCIDFRKLNALCKADSEPLPIIDNLLDKLARAKF